VEEDIAIVKMNLEALIEAVLSSNCFTAAEYKYEIAVEH